MGLTVAVAACGDDGVTPSNLSEEEAQDLATAIFAQSFFTSQSLSYDQPSQSAGGPDLAVQTYSEQIEATVSCELGGNVALDATIEAIEDDETGAAEIDLSMSMVHNACGAQSESGRTWTLWGDPGIDMDFSATTDGGDNASFSGSIVGTVEWSSDGKEGPCSISFEFSGETNATGMSFAMGGNVCGTSFQQELSVS